MTSLSSGRGRCVAASVHLRLCPHHLQPVGAVYLAIEADEENFEAYLHADASILLRMFHRSSRCSCRDCGAWHDLIRSPVRPTAITRLHRNNSPDLTTSQPLRTTEEAYPDASVDVRLRA